MGVNKVVYGGQAVIDLTDATATQDTILAGYTAYGANGDLIVGTASSTKRQEINAVLSKTGWEDGKQVVHITGVTVDSSIVVGGDLGSEPEYSDCGVYCSSQLDGALEFTTMWIPDSDLVANILILT